MLIVNYINHLFDIQIILYGYFASIKLKPKD